MTLELDRLRAGMPGVANRVHLNNAGAALMPARPCAVMEFMAVKPKSRSI